MLITRFTKLFTDNVVELGGVLTIVYSIVHLIVLTIVQTFIYVATYKKSSMIRRLPLECLIPDSKDTGI